METIKDLKTLIRVLSDLDIEQHITIKIGYNVLDLYDDENGLYLVDRKEIWRFKDMDEMETFIQWWYLLEN